MPGAGPSACGDANSPASGPVTAPAVCFNARISLTMGLLSLVLTLLTGPFAVLWGIEGLREIRRSSGRVRGTWAALAGIGTGLVGSLLGVWLIVAAVGVVQETRDRAT